MNERISDFAAAPAPCRIDVEQRLDALLRRANERLDALTSDASVQALRRSLDARPTTVPYSLELGRARLTASELDALEPESIVPLSDASNGAAVQIWIDGRLQGRGALLVVDGKLAVRVETLEPR
ncbi:MAG: FliM/FliN family flagellar motor switch protein [Thermoguttaceae bacterium]|nr:FliM/FliN family flagellar motor switch protein [Thermoguttaceae bacterium]MBQ6828015.1 FliM/FliN family flagellar motor switch protein [Thermoguttaceae bacterium]